MRGAVRDAFGAFHHKVAHFGHKLSERTEDLVIDEYANSWEYRGTYWQVRVLVHFG